MKTRLNSYLFGYENVDIKSSIIFIVFPFLF